MGPVEEAVRADLEAMGRVGKSGLAASAVRTAQQLDAKYHPLAATELRQTMAALRELAPAEEKADSIDQLSARRARRRGA